VPASRRSRRTHAFGRGWPSGASSSPQAIPGASCREIVDTATVDLGSERCLLRSAEAWAFCLSRRFVHNIGEAVMRAVSGSKNLPKSRPQRYGQSDLLARTPIILGCQAQPVLATGGVSHISRISRSVVSYRSAGMRDLLGPNDPPRSDSDRLHGQNATRDATRGRWDAGVRYWPEYILVGSAVVLFIGLRVVIGFTNGAFLAGAVVASYPLVLALVPMRKRLVPREVGSAASATPMRLWVVGWSLLGATFGWSPLAFHSWGASDNGIIIIAAYALWCALALGSAQCIRKASAWGTASSAASMDRQDG
jgi:hypothetical protein